MCDSTDTDFYVENKDVTDVGDDNTCQTTFHWNDVGATGCTDKCLPEEEEDEQKEKKTGGGGAITFATYTGPTIGLPEGEEGGQEGGAGEQQGEPEITGPGSIQEGNEMTFTLINSDSTPADGQVTITKPDGTTMTVSVTGGALHVDFDQPGTWTITYTDPSGKTVTKTINVLAAPEEETPPAPIPQPVIQPKTPAPTDNTLLYLLGGAVLLGFVAVLFLKKSGRI